MRIIRFIISFLVCLITVTVIVVSRGTVFALPFGIWAFLEDRRLAWNILVGGYIIEIAWLILFGYCIRDVIRFFKEKGYFKGKSKVKDISQSLEKNHEAP